MQHVRRLAVALLLGVSVAESQDEGPELQVPPGFVVERVAGPPLLERPMMAGFDDEGRLYVCVSSGFNLTKGTSDLLVKDPPHSVVRLEDTDGDGRFDKSVVFADKMTFPMGALWHDGALYVASAPYLWKLEDTDGDGVADRRTIFVGKFDFGGNGCDLHGAFLGPDGRIYWANCQRGFEIRRTDGSMLKGKAAGVFRIRPDGGEVEFVCGGGMDNPVEVAFTDEGEAFVTANIVAGNPTRHDAILHCVEGASFPKDGNRYLKRTGDLMPSMIDLGWVAPAGLLRARSGALGRDVQGSLFSALFNVRKVQRHAIERDGATFRRTAAEDFLASPHPDFHPTDVLEDADGSLLVVDTGGWFIRGCPTSRVEKPLIKGGLYRIRRKDMPRVEDPWGKAIAWKGIGPDRLAALLDDPRFAVRDRAIHEIAKRGAVEALEETLAKSPSARARLNAVWALTRIDGPRARAAVRPALSDRETSVRLAAAHSAGLHRDGESLDSLVERVRSTDPAPVRRQAATALGRIRNAKAVPALLDGLRAGGDRFLDHAFIYALIEIADREATARGLQDPSPLVRRGALIALDQMEGGNLTRELVVAQLDPAHPALQQAALAIVSSRPAWAGELAGFVREWLGRETSGENGREDLGHLLVAFSADSEIQDLVALTLRRESTPAATRLALLETMARAPLDPLPPVWVAELRWSLLHPDERVARQAVSTVRAAGVKGLEEALLRLGRDPSRGVELRVDALAAAAARLRRLEAPLFSFLVENLNPAKPALLRMTAAHALGSAALDGEQLNALLRAVATAGPLELPRLLGAYERSKSSGSLAQALVAALAKSPGLEGLPAETLRRTLEGYPGDVLQLAAPLFKRLDVDLEKQKARLAELEPTLPGGDAARGREVFFGKKAACASCHTAQGQGGRVGPELTKIGTIRQARDLLEAVVFPSASFVRGYEPITVRTRDGSILNGIVVRETAEAIFLADAERAERKVPKPSIEEIRQSRVSIMPQGLDAQLAREELRDLIAFLQSLR